MDTPLFSLGKGSTQPVSSFYTQGTNFHILNYFQQLKDKLSIAYLKLSRYISPLYIAYCYEAKQGHKHIQLAQELRDTSFYLNSAVSTLRHEV